jgi:hypothetical protein
MALRIGLRRVGADFLRELLWIFFGLPGSRPLIWMNRIHADGIDHPIHADTTGQLGYCLDWIDVIEINVSRALRLRHVQPRCTVLFANTLPAPINNAFITANWLLPTHSQTPPPIGWV